MADTDDEQTAELGSDHHAEGEDEKAPGAEAAGQDRRSKEWEAGADLDRAAMALGTSDEDAEALREAERHEQARDQIEQDARAERDRQDTRYRHAVNRADAEVAEALRLANVADTARADYRAEAAGERRLARTDAARATQLRAGAAGRDDPAAEVDRSRADRYQAMSNYETRLANSDDAISDSYGAEPRDRQVEAAQIRRPEQPPAAEAVRVPPQEAPSARNNVKRRRPKTKELKDFGLGD
jgi:hypothetical protein